MESSLVSNFLAFLENHFGSINHIKMTTLIHQYSKLDFKVSSDALTIKQTIDSVFECFYGHSLSELIDIFNKEEKQTQVISKTLALEQEIVELKDTIEELRQSYWNLKHK